MKLRGRKLKIDEVEKGGSWEVIYSHLIRIQHTRQEGAAPESSLTVNLGSCAEEAYK
jgi:hypothetical protein